MKESDFMSQFIKEWEYLFENFYRPPAAIGSELKIYYKVLSVRLSVFTCENFFA